MLVLEEFDCIEWVSHYAAVGASTVNILRILSTLNMKKMPQDESVKMNLMAFVWSADTEPKLH